MAFDWGSYGQFLDKMAQQRIGGSSIGSSVANSAINPYLSEEDQKNRQATSGQPLGRQAASMGTMRMGNYLQGLSGTGAAGASGAALSVPSMSTAASQVVTPATASLFGETGGSLIGSGMGSSIASGASSVGAGLSSGASAVGSGLSSMGSSAASGIGQLISMIGSMFSDETVKKNKKQDSHYIESFLDSLGGGN